MASTAAAQTCSVLSSSTVALPSKSGTMPGSSDITTAGGSQYLYVLTEWGFARGSLAVDPGNPNPGSPASFSLTNIGLRLQNGGAIPITCDCFQGGSVGAAAENPTGDARMISDCISMGSEGVGGLPGQLATTGNGNPPGSPTFGQQVALPSKGSGRPAAIYVASTQKYFGYWSTNRTQDGVQVADITNPSGQRLQLNAIVPQKAVSWSAGAAGVRLVAAHVAVPGYDKDLLVGGDASLHVGTIDSNNGFVTEVASASFAGGSTQQLDIAVVNNAIYIFSAEAANGLRVYEFQPPGTLLNVSNFIPGNFNRLAVRGPAPFPVLFAHRKVGGNESYVDVYDTRWVDDPSRSPVLGISLRHFGATDANYIGVGGFEALVQQNGTSVNAYLYREVVTSPEASIKTHKLDISCIATDPNAPPAANATMTNLSAATRPAPENTKNYYGDKWNIQDSSTSFNPIVAYAWDVNTGAAGPFQGDGSYSTAGLNPAYWPCEPNAGGNLTTGASCYTSLGSPQTGTYYLGHTATNSGCSNCGTSSPFFSAGVPVSAPALSILGFDGTTLRVLTGGTADARGSQGNTAEAAFNWTFPGGNPSTATGLNPTVPTGATSFTLTAAYIGGYSKSLQGGVQQVDLVPAFSATPNPVLISATLTLKNLMQISGAPNVHLDSASYVVKDGTGATVSSGSLASGFLPINGTAGLTAPSTAGAFTVTVTYNYHDHNNATASIAATMPFSTTTFSPNPVLTVFLGAQQQFPFGNPPTYSLATSTAYNLFDGESLPGGVNHPGAAFYKSTNGNNSVSGDTLLGTSSSAGPVAFTPAACSSSCFLKVVVPNGGSAINVAGYTAGGSGPPPPPTPTVAFTAAPTTGSLGVPVTFTATATNFTGNPTFAWNWGDASGPPPPPPPPPPPGGCPPGVGCDITPDPSADIAPDPAAATTATSESQSHSYNAAGNYTVTVTATSGSTSRSATAHISITGVVGPPRPSSSFDISGGGATLNGFDGSWTVPAGSPVTFAGAEADPLASFSWDFGDGSAAGSGRTVTHAFTRQGNPNVTVTVTSPASDTVTTGTSSGLVHFHVTAPSFQAIMIPGAGSILADSGNWATDLSVTNPGTQSTTLTLYFAAFSDAIPDDLSTLPFQSLFSFPLGGGQSASFVDVVGSPAPPCTNSCGLGKPGAGKGILFIKFDGGDQVPIVTSRVYFTSQGASYGTALPSLLTGPFGSTQAQSAQMAMGQYLIGLRSDDLYRFNISLFNASAQGGLFHVDAFSEDGGHASAGNDFAVPAFSQAGLNPADVISSLDPTKRYVLKVTSTAGTLQAYASQLDRRNNDLAQIADDTPVVAAAPGNQVDYYVPGVGRIEDAGSNTHWRTDLRLFNASSLPRDLTLEFRYTPTGSTSQSRILSSLTLPPGQGISIDDVVGNADKGLAAGHPELLTGTALGLLHVYYNAPTDIATAPLKIGGRIYADLSTGTAGMQLSTYTAPQSVAPNQGTLVMPGAQTNLRFRTNIGVFSLGDLPTAVHVEAFKQNGTMTSTFDYTLNDPGRTGAFAQIPMTALSNLDGSPMTIKVKSLSGSPVGAYIVTVDQISADTVFIQGKPIN